MKARCIITSSINLDPISDKVSVILQSVLVRHLWLKHRTVDYFDVIANEVSKVSCSA